MTLNALIAVLRARRLSPSDHGDSPIPAAPHVRRLFPRYLRAGTVPDRRNRFSDRRQSANLPATDGRGAGRRDSIREGRRASVQRCADLPQRRSGLLSVEAATNGRSMRASSNGPPSPISWDSTRRSGWKGSAAATPASTTSAPSRVPCTSSILRVKIDLWQLVHDYHRWLPWFDALYGSATYLPMADGALYDIKASPSGLLARPLNEAARNAVGNWH